VLACDTERFSTFALWELIFAPAICQRKVWKGLARVDGWLGAPVRKAVNWSAGRFTGGLDAVHRLSLEEPEEDFLLLTPIFCCFILLVMFPFSPEIQNLAFFDERVPRKRRLRVMEFYRAMVQRHLYVEGTSRCFLSKNVSFTPMIESLREVFPDARWVVCLRSPLETVPSQISAIEPSWKLFGNPLSAELFTQRWLELMDYYYTHLAEVLPTVAEHQNICMEMKTIRRELEKSVLSLYGVFEDPITPRFARILKDEAEAAAEYRSRHHYSLEKYGLKESDLESRFGTSWNILRDLCQKKVNDET
jgi:hypothetical protein